MTCQHRRAGASGEGATYLRRPGHTRAGDRERDRAATLLGDAHAEGYLTFEELDARLGQVWAATTTAELERLCADLPAALRERVTAAEDPTPQPRSFGCRVGTYVRVMLLLVAIWLVVGLTHGSWYPWPVWPALGWGFALAAPHAALRTVPGR